MTDLNPLEIFRWYKDLEHQRNAILYWWNNTPKEVREEFVRIWRSGSVTRKINTAGLQLIKEFEGLRLQSYLCPAGKWTIGYGHTKTARPGQTITREQADQLLQADLAEYEACVQNLVKVPLTDNQFAALVSLAFNIGCAAFARSTLLKLLNQGDYHSAAQQFQRWAYANGKLLPGLARRRQQESTLFLK